jgi:RHS repeat-associated protein
VYVASPDHTIVNNTFRHTSSYGVYNAKTQDFVVNAINNDWGHGSGPAPFGTGTGVNYRTCYTPVTKRPYVCELYVNVSPWIGREEYYKGNNGRNIPWQKYDADPVNTATGNYTHSTVDFNIPIKGDLVFVWERTYNSLLPDTDKGLGFGWKHSYDFNLIEEEHAVFVEYGDGRLVKYSKSGENFLRPEGVYDTLERLSGGGYKLTSKEMTNWFFDSSGSLIRIADRNGHGLIFVYSDGKMSSVTDTDNHLILNISYVEDRISSITDMINRSVSYGYDDDGNLISITDCGGGVNLFTYDDNHRMLTARDANETVYLTNLFDEEGRVLKQWDAENHLTEFYYDTINTQTYVKQRTGGEFRYVYDQYWRLIKIYDPYGNMTTYEYDHLHNLTKKTDPLGNITTYTYDQNGNQTSILDSLDGLTTTTYDTMNNVLTTTNALGQMTTNEYDENGNLIAVEDPIGNRTLYTYSNNPSHLGLLTSVSDPLGFVNQFDYDDYGHTVSHTSPGGLVTNISYDLAGRKISESDSLGNIKTYTYNALGLITSITDGLGNEKSFTYDLVGNKLSETDEEGNTNLYTYTLRDDIATVTNALGYKTEFNYDGNQNQISIKDPNDGLTQYAYDYNNRIIKITDPLNKQRSFVYDKNGNQTKVTNELGHVTNTNYDALNRITSIVDALGNTTSYGYDAIGNRTSLTDPNGNATTYTYNATNLLIRVEDALNGIAEYEYDANGNKIKEVDLNGNETNYQYDNENRLISTTSPLGFISTLSYDLRGNLISSTNFEGVNTFYEYDANNQLTKILYSDSSQVVFTYDKVGNRKSMSDSTGITTWIYDALSRPTSIVSPNGTINYTYDAFNRIKMISNQGEVNYDYNANNQLITITSWDGLDTHYAYDAQGKVKTITYPNNIIAYRSYDDAERLLEINYKNGESTINRIVYTLDNNGNRLTMTDNDGQTEYMYDALNRIVKVIYPMGEPGVVEYTYDSAGNRLTMVEDDSTTSYVYDAENRLISMTENSIPTTFVYDNDGNLLSKDNEQLTWGVNGKLTGWTNGVEEITYTYNGLGDRISIVENGTIINLSLDYAAGGVVLREDSSLSTIDYLVGKTILAQKSDGNTVYFANDGLGSTREIIDGSGVVVASYSYDVFGMERQGSEMTNYKFAGERQEKINGYIYLQSRYYDPTIGRFISKDIFNGFDERPQTLNKFTYVENNPVNLIDPMGTSSKESDDSNSNYGEFTWELPWYYKALKFVLNKTTLKIGPLKIFDGPKILKNMGIGSADFWKYFGTTKKVFGIIDDGMDLLETSERAKANQQNGVYGKSDEAQSANLGKYVPMMRGVEIGVGLIPNTYTGFGSTMKSQKTFSNFTDRFARRQGALIDLAVMDPGSTDFMDALDRANRSFR